MKTYTEEEVRLVIAGMQVEIDALKLVQQEQAGWQLVPVEPTEAMLGAALRHVIGMASMPAAYRAMLAAAPKGEKP